MPRQARETSGTGIYHVMMRGINHQNIFEEQEDYYQFLNTLDVMAQSYDPDGNPGGRNYTLWDDRGRVPVRIGERPSLVYSLMY